MRWKFCVAVVAVLAMAGGCSTLGTIEQARNALDQAETAGAPAKAPYAFHKGKIFLEMAEHERDEFDWAAAGEWAQVALEHAQEALEKAKGGAR